MPSIIQSNETAAAAIGQRFRDRYGTVPRIFRAPGRVNLIGEHTDYNDGFVMPAAIDFYTWVAVSPREDGILHVETLQFTDSAEWPTDGLFGPPRNHWSDYVRGLAAVLQSDEQWLAGANLMIDGHVPLGAGLSSSAAIEVAVALALLSTAKRSIESAELAKLCQRAEHEYAGTRCGIMDQFIAVSGRAGQALMLDCRSLEYKHLPIPREARLVICNSMVKHELAAGKYNKRRAECEAGVDILRRNLPAVRALRDVTMADLESHRGELREVVHRRCRHVVSENNRVLESAEALQNGDLLRFGQLMYDSHRSLRDDYEVSCAEVDLLVELAAKQEGVYGARMTGGGFGGCTINLVKADSADRIREHLAASYTQLTGIRPEVYICAAAEGAGEWRR